MKYQIILISDRVEKFIAVKSIGTVHSVYRKTINFVAGGELFSLQAQDSVLSPISLITDLTPNAMSNLTVQPGDEVLISSEFISIKNLVFCLINAQISTLSSLQYMPNFDIDCLRTSINKAIDNAHTTGFEEIFKGNIHSPILKYAHSCMSECKTYILEKNYRSGANALCRLIGLGQGLTPSGDDFLCGVFAALTIIGNRFEEFSTQLKTAVQENLNNTNDISGAFLQCAINNEYSQPVMGLLNLPNDAEVLSSFSRIGHSSGIDTLCGILYVLEL